MKKKILIIDDEPDILKVTFARLKVSGYDVITAASAEEGFKLIGKDKPDLILLDLILPGMQGEDLCKVVKSDKELSKIPVLLFTATVDDIYIKAKLSCADDYILKPFDPDELLAKIKKLIK